jgi:hypothetical protein
MIVQLHRIQGDKPSDATCWWLCGAGEETNTTSDRKEDLGVVLSAMKLLVRDPYIFKTSDWMMDK